MIFQDTLDSFPDKSMKDSGSSRQQVTKDCLQDQNGAEICNLEPPNPPCKRLKLIRKGWTIIFFML